MFQKCYAKIMQKLYEKRQGNTYLHFGSKYATAFIFICRTQPENQILSDYMSCKIR